MENDRSPKVDPRVEQALRALMVNLESSARKIGLYLEQTGMAMEYTGDDGDETLSEVLVMADFVVGDRAFGATMADPAVKAIEKDLGQITTENRDAEWEAMRERYRRGELGGTP